MFPVRFDSLFGLAKGRPDITADLSALKLPATESLKTAEDGTGSALEEVPWTATSENTACGMWISKSMRHV